MVSLDAPSFGIESKRGRMTVLNDLEYALWTNEADNSSAQLSEDEFETAYEHPKPTTLYGMEFYSGKKSAERGFVSRGASSFVMHEMLTDTGHKTAEISSMFLILCTFFAMHQLNVNTRNM